MALGKRFLKISKLVTQTLNNNAPVRHLFLNFIHDRDCELNDRVSGICLDKFDGSSKDLCKNLRIRKSQSYVGVLDFSQTALSENQELQHRFGTF